VQFVWRSLARLGVREEQLADATQDVFVVVHRRLADFEQRSSLKTWIFGIALRVASTVRRSHRRVVEPLSEDLVDQRAEAPFEAAVRSEAVGLLYRALGELTDDQRAMFILVELEQMSVPEAAAAVNANLHTATSRLKTARRRFDEAVQRRRGQGESHE